jgi:hypothetical protein
MGRAYSQDLRDPVIDAGTSARAAAERFGVGVATAIVWTSQTGERCARKQGQPKAPNSLRPGLSLASRRSPTWPCRDAGRLRDRGLGRRDLDLPRPQRPDVQKRPTTRPSRTAPTTRSDVHQHGRLGVAPRRGSASGPAFPMGIGRRLPSRPVCASTGLPPQWSSDGPIIRDAFQAYVDRVLVPEFSPATSSS